MVVVFGGVEVVVLSGLEWSVFAAAAAAAANNALPYL